MACCWKSPWDLVSQVPPKGTSCGWPSSAALRAEWACRPGDARHTPSALRVSPLCSGHPTSCTWPVHSPNGSTEPSGLGRPRSQARASRMCLWLLAPRQTRSQSNRAHPRRGSRQRRDPETWSPRRAHGTQRTNAGPSATLLPPTPQLATAQNAAAPSFGTARHHLRDHVGPALPWQSPQAVLGRHAGRQALAFEKPHQENTLCLSSYVPPARAAGQCLASRLGHFAAGTQGRRPGAGPVKI